LLLTIAPTATINTTIAQAAAPCAGSVASGAAPKVADTAKALEGGAQFVNKKTQNSFLVVSFQASFGLITKD
jgi:hypothetical protein